jgi:transposase-like protein
LEHYPLARKRGVYTGRRTGTTKAAPSRARTLKRQGLTIVEIAKALGVKERTVYHYLVTLGEEVHHRTNRYLNNHLEQDHRGIKQRIRPMGGFKSVESAKRFCRVHDEVRNFLRPRSYRNEVISLAQRRLLHTARTRILLTSLAVA